MESGDLIEKVLEIYLPNARYLKSAEFNFPEIKGQFEIPSPCYVQGTGHFNAVEAIICYNQLAYTFFSSAIDQGVEEVIKVADPMSVDEFIKEGQLPYSFIVRSQLKFQKPIDSGKFYGSIKLKRASRMGPSSFFMTEAGFWDDYEGKSSGEFLLAFAPYHEKALQA